MSGTQAEGLRYQRKIGALLRKLFADAEIISDQWIRFEDENGLGWAQPDHVVVEEVILWILECKRTHTAQAGEQLVKLYSPLCREIWPNHEQILVEAAHHLGRGQGGKIPPRIRELDEVFKVRPRAYYLWHRL